jgi:integrase
MEYIQCSTSRQLKLHESRFLPGLKSRGYTLPHVYVYPCYPEWAEDWNLRQRILPPVKTERTNDKIDHSVTPHLSPKLPFVPYDLRHAYAICTLSFFWPVEFAAQIMGHSLDVHCKTYHRWISRKRRQEIYEFLMNRSESAQAPWL